MLIMTEQSKIFLQEYLPDIITESDLKTALRKLYRLIDEKGFAPPHFDEYNDFGREAQRVYDDLYLSNAKKNKQNC